ncbi:nitroreductase [Endozoicomonas gorgoniicola]|uniref:Putative NAD(P)H nitroreductase n=1 Tax=Endozoicomonas gorgoniicola TaxID=1234144 RepID=A0ABT3MPH9_9GAMM|nr:nitroreductase [Endozoicomonas gorgoniicola]MCW7551267.1 nitroreductase [Endozoicomonas gorgoniicola]
MELLQGLQQRVSTPRLIEPAPDARQLEQIFQAALRAPDHARLRPWRFLTISGEARHALGEVFARAALEDQPDLAPEAIARFKGLPLRAPLLVALVCKVKEHPKVPDIEQQMSVATAAQNILNAAYALGLGAMWRTGAVNYHPATARGLGLAENEQLLGFIYMGTPGGSAKKLEPLEVKDYVMAWEG